MARFAALLLLSAAPLAAQRLPHAPVTMEVPLPPTPFVREGAVTLVYELHLTNLSSMPLVIHQVDVLSGLTRAPIASYQGDDVTSRVVRPVPALKLIDPRMIESGKRAIFYLWIPLTKGQAVPASLLHRVTLQPVNGPGPFLDSIMTGAPVTLPAVSARQIGPPLRGGPWAARFNSNTGGHRRAFVVVDGRFRLAQRLAIDFGTMGPDGQTARDSGLSNTDFYSYGQDVLAVGDGIVSVARDGMAENAPNATTVPLAVLDDAVGNHIALDLGAGAFALYAHLRPGSLRVKAGDRVRKGQVIAQVGNTGSSVGPHLHFELMNHADFAHGDGLPFVFDQFTLLGIESMDQFFKGDWDPDPGFTVRKVLREMPADMAILRF